MHFARIDGDDITGLRLDDPAATQRFLGALQHDTDAELVMRVPAKRMRRIGGHCLDAFE